MRQAARAYPVHQSPFYKLASKEKLSRLLKISQKQLIGLTDDSRYRVFVKDGREIQEPVGIRKTVHGRVKELLSRMECPEYLFSGVKRKSAIGNARFHMKNNYAMVLDIKSFYRSSKIEYIFRFFRYELKMSEDTARILSKILSYNDFIPTGSQSSQLLAFWTYSVLFYNINSLAEEHDILFSLYVDDMTFSSKKRIPNQFDLHINKLLNSVELGIKKKKTKYYFSTDAKRITGCIIITAKNELRVPNAQKKKIVNLLGMRKSEKSTLQKEKIKRSLLGSISQVQQIENEIFIKTRTQLRNN
jgi:RNA-directed DNA polymerase